MEHKVTKNKGENILNFLSIRPIFGANPIKEIYSKLKKSQEWSYIH